ncbi:hypothetical protein [Halomonas halmophila]|uniref:hypothetical protein n=1 Tax=Halomonas halmophila TaxID=252 RepID=UPI00114158BD|nr:hypothetical protein [Halomonas halmophila]
MPRYYVNTNTDDNGNHEVHTTGCPHPPADKNRLPLGIHDSCGPATAAARTKFGQQLMVANGAAEHVIEAVDHTGRLIVRS